MYLEKYNVKQKELAEELNVDQATISKYANGLRVPHFSTAIVIANFFNLNLDEFLGIPALNATDERRLFSKFIEEQNELIKKYLRPKNGSTNVNAQESNGRISKFTISCNHSAISMYPQANDHPHLATHAICDSYLIVNENIYPERHFEMLWSSENEHISFYDYVNSMLDHEDNPSCMDETYRRLRKMMNVYVQNRHLFGVLGTLTASRFY